MHTSEAIDQIATALAAAQAEIVNPAKDAENPHFKSRYADLATGLTCTRPVLAKHGIAAVQMTHMDGSMMYLITRLVHKSGQWIEGVYPVANFPARHQEIGSALTYARRYSLFALVGIAGADDDDDGNEASKKETPAPKKAAPAIDVQALTEEGNSRAQCGMKAYETWWKHDLTPDERDALGGAKGTLHATFKASADLADRLRGETEDEAQKEAAE